MIEQAIQRYYRFFDETLESSTFVVLFITLIIFFVGAAIPNASAQANLYKTSIFESQLAEKLSENNIVVIDGVSYKLSFSRIPQ